MSQRTLPLQRLTLDKAHGPYAIFAPFVLVGVLVSGQILCPWGDVLTPARKVEDAADLGYTDRKRLAKLHLGVSLLSQNQMATHGEHFL